MIEPPVARAQITNDAEEIVARTVQVIRGLGANALGSPLGDAGASAAVDFTTAGVDENGSTTSEHAFLIYEDTLGDPTCFVRVQGNVIDYLSS